MKAFRRIVGGDDKCNLPDALRSVKDYPQLAITIETAFIATDGTIQETAGQVGINERVVHEQRASLLREFQLAYDLTPTVGIRIVDAAGEITVYPAGAKLLDDRIINDVLVWLEPWPEVESQFRAALTIYMAGNKALYRELLDDLRKSIEEAAGKVVGGSRSLENNRTDLLRWVTERGMNSEIARMFHTLVSHFAEYQNENVKHGDIWSHGEVEFMIYLTGTFLRLLIQLQQVAP
jgi:hypothetical protein